MYTVLFENQDYLIVNKESGILVHSTNYQESGTLIQRIIREKGMKVYPVHRIDRNTSGILLIAKSKSSVFFLQSLFLNQKIEKNYLAIVSKPLPAKELKITLSLGRSRNNKLFFSNKNAKNYKNACTKAFVIEKTLVKLILKTGRTHQIRAHLFSIGSSVLNDPIYGTLLKDDPFNQYLHAYSLRFICPFTNELRFVKAPLPSPFLRKLDELEIKFDENLIDSIGSEEGVGREN